MGKVGCAGQWGVVGVGGGIVLGDELSVVEEVAGPTLRKGVVG